MKMKSLSIHPDEGRKSSEVLFEYWVCELDQVPNV